MTMKLVITFLFCLAVVVKSENASILEYLMEVSVECVDEVNATTADFMDFLKLDSKPSPEGKCLRMCVLKKAKIISPEGKLSITKLGKLVKSITDGDIEAVKRAQEIGKSCEDAAKDESEFCEIGYLLDKCFRKQIADGKMKFDI